MTQMRDVFDGYSFNEPETNRRYFYTDETLQLVSEHNYISPTSVTGLILDMSNRHSLTI